MPGTGRPWSPEEIELIEGWLADGIPPVMIAPVLDRTMSSLTGCIKSRNLQVVVGKTSTSASAESVEAITAANKRFVAMGQALGMRNQVALRGDVPQSRPTACVTGVSSQTLASGVSAKASAPFVLLGGRA